MTGLPSRTIYPIWVFQGIPWQGMFVDREAVTLIEDNKPKILSRLRRIEGQVRGVARMVEQDRYCIDILTQTQALRAALARIEAMLLRDHIDHCVRSAFSSGDVEDQGRKIDELVEVLQRTAR